jgi:hypothetical protein
MNLRSARIPVLDIVVADCVATIALAVATARYTRCSVPLSLLLWFLLAETAHVLFEVRTPVSRRILDPHPNAGTTHHAAHPHARS